jgi:hypothetical protein
VRRKRAVARRRVMPETKIAHYPDLNTLGNPDPPASFTINAGIPEEPWLHDIRSAFIIPESWQTIQQGTQQNQLLGREMFSESLMLNLKINFDRLITTIPSARVRIMHGWVNSQAAASGYPLVHNDEVSQVYPITPWGHEDHFSSVAASHVLQQLGVELSSLSNKCITILSDKKYTFSGQSAAGGPDGSGVSANTAVYVDRADFQKKFYWPTKKKMTYKVVPLFTDRQAEIDIDETAEVVVTNPVGAYPGANTDTSQSNNFRGYTMAPIQTERIPFVCVWWQNANNTVFSPDTQMLNVKYRTHHRFRDP